MAQVKKRVSLESREVEKLKRDAEEIGWAEFPDADDITVQFRGQELQPIIFPWFNGKAKAYAVTNQILARPKSEKKAKKNPFRDKPAKVPFNPFKKAGTLAKAEAKGRKKSKSKNPFR